MRGPAVEFGAVVGIRIVLFCAVVLTACAGQAGPVPLSSLLPGVADLPPGAETSDIAAPDELVLSIALDAPSDGLGLPDERTFDPPECRQRNDIADAARIGLVEDGFGRGVRMAGERTYVLLVSETDVDMTDVGGVCASYKTGFAEVRTTLYDMPADFGAERSIAMHEVTDPTNPAWAGEEILSGYALVSGYTVLVLGFVGAEFRAEFFDVFTRSVATVAANS